MAFNKDHLAVFGCLLFLAAVGASCRQNREEVKVEDKDPVIAVLNGREVRRSSFEAFVRSREIDPEGNQGGTVSESEILREFFIDRLLLQEARAAGIKVSDQELADHFGRFQDKENSNSGRELPELRELLMLQKFVRWKINVKPNIAVEQMQDYYRNHQGEFVVNDRIHVLEILVDEEEKAAELRKKLRRRDFRTFRQMARQHSKGLTAKDGGDLGTFETGELPEEFEKVIFKLKPGEISPVFRTEHGYHIFMAEEFIPRHPLAFHEAQRTIFEKMMAEQERTALAGYVAELLDNASIQILDPDLQFDWRETNAKAN